MIARAISHSVIPIMSKPDIIGITESWTHSAISDSELYLEGYQLFRCDRKSSSNGGGVLLYVNSELNPVEFFTKTPYGGMCGVR